MARTVEMNWPKEYSILYKEYIFYSRASCPDYKLGRVGWEPLITAQEKSGHQSVGGEQLYCALLVSFGFLAPLLIKIIDVVIIINIIIRFYFVSFIKLLFSQPTGFTFLFFPFLLLTARWGAGGD